jgi:hypothetical protein
MNTEMLFTENLDNTFQASGICFTTCSINEGMDERPDKWRINYDTESKSWGAAIYYTRIDADGKMWVGNGEYESQVNYCPITGKKSKVKIDQPFIEEQ